MSDQLTEIAVVLDRSGSMSRIKDDMEGGLWTMIVEQHGLPGECRVSLYRFDDVFEVSFEGRSSGDIKREDVLLVPRGNTALNDAVVKSLSAVESRIIAESVKPDIVVVVVITDGQENASKENTVADVQKAIERATDKFGWKFVFLAADPKGFVEGQIYTQGITRGVAVASYTADSSGVGIMNARYSSAIADLRAGLAKDIDLDKKK